MSGRLLFKEKQLRLCVVAALTSMAAPVAESLVLPPKPLASNITWSCQPGVRNDWLCSGTDRQKYKPDVSYAQQSGQALSDIKQPAAYVEPYPSLPVPAGNPESLVTLLESPGNHYVLQWMAAKERGQLEALRQRYPVLQDATIAQYQRSGKIWYVLLDGPYPSRIEAMAELDSPPRSHMARELYPWTRSLASIQKLDIIRPQYPAEQLAETDPPDYPPELPIQENRITPVNYDVPYDISYNTGQNRQQALLPQQAYSSRAVRSIPDRTNVETDYGKRHVANSADVADAADADVAALPYGSEFSNTGYSDFNRDQGYRILPEQASPQEMYVSITPAYRSRIPQQHTTTDVDYNVQGIPVSLPADDNLQPVFDQPEPVRPAINVLTANPKSYTIEWMNASRKASLERARLRYSELQNTQIIHYQSNSRNRYALVSMLFVNRSDALDALLTPSLSRVSARFSPRVRKVAWLQSLVGSTPQATHAWTGPNIEPSIHKRQWIGQDGPGEQTYIVRRQDFEPQPVEAEARVMSFNEVATPAVHRQMMAYQRTETDQPLRFDTGYQPDNSNGQSDSHGQINALLSSPGNSYTIQWFSSSNRQSIEKLQQRFPELASAVIVHVQRNRKDWYVLVQGKYRNSQEAIMALKSPSMKDIALILHPWTRPLKSLQKQQIASL